MFVLQLYQQVSRYTKLHYNCWFIIILAFLYHVKLWLQVKCIGKEGITSLDFRTIVKAMKLWKEVKAMHNLLPFTIITCYLLGCNLKIHAHWIWTSYKSQTCKPYIYKSDNTYHYCYWRCNKTKSHFRCKLWSHPNLYSCLNQIFSFCFKCRLSLWFKNFNE